MWKLIEILILKNDIGNLFPNLCFIYNIYLNLKFDCEREPVYSPSWPVFNALYLNCYNCWTIHLTGPKFLWGILHMYPFYKIAWLMTNGLVQLYRVSQIIATFHFTPVLQQSTIWFFFQFGPNPHSNGWLSLNTIFLRGPLSSFGDFGLFWVNRSNLKFSSYVNCVQIFTCFTTKYHRHFFSERPEISNWW